MLSPKYKHFVKKNNILINNILFLLCFMRKILIKWIFERDIFGGYIFTVSFSPPIVKYIIKEILLFYLECNL